MRVAWFGLLALASCGGSEVKSQRLNDGSWKFTCELAMDECVRRAQVSCRNQRFRIIEGTSEVRLRDASPYEKAYHTSRLHLVCTDLGSDVLIDTSSKQADGDKAAASSCSKGETRACIGPAACKGGQTCLPDGSGFGSCDCGGAAEAPASLPASTSPAPPEALPAAATPAPAAGAAGGPSAPPAPAPK